jgi:hypothetical protein
MAMIDDDEAIRRAVRAFYEGAGFPELEKASGKKLKYTKEFFDGYEKDLRKPTSKTKLDKSAKPLEEISEEEI